MNSIEPEKSPHGNALRRGWTTGACATAAARSALTALLSGRFEDPVTIVLPGGQTPAFALTHEALGTDYAEAGIIKDAGDDPDVTHGATIITRVTRGAPGAGIVFQAGTGVGTFTKPGLPLPVGEPAINPAPREMMTKVVGELCETFKTAPDFTLTISVPNGEKIATKTWNPRLGIVGGISILGTTGIVIPYSCSAWIHSIHSGVDVARAMGISHIVGATGDRSEQAAKSYFSLQNEALIDMGDFVGGLLKYVRQKPVKRVTIAGGFAKLSKLAQGALDLHSARSTVDLDQLASLLEGMGADAEMVAAARAANTANEVLGMARAAHLPLAEAVAKAACAAAAAVLKNTDIEVGILIIDRSGTIIAEAG